MKKKEETCHVKEKSQLSQISPESNGDTVGMGTGSRAKDLGLGCPGQEI